MHSFLLECLSSSSYVQSGWSWHLLQFCDLIEGPCSRCGPPSTPSAGVQSLDNTPFTLRHLCEHLQLEYSWRHTNTHTHTQSHAHRHTDRLSLQPLRLLVAIASWVIPVSDWVWVLGVTRGRNVFVLGSLRGRHLLVLTSLWLSQQGLVGGRKRK